MIIVKSERREWNEFDRNKNKNSKENKIINSIDVFRDDKWAYTITESEFRDILFELSKNRLGVPTVQTLKDTVSLNALPPAFRWVVNINRDDREE